jgi:hypothetical protein
MTEANEKTVVALLPGYPQRITLCKAAKRWWEDTFRLAHHAICPISDSLPDPKTEFGLQEQAIEPPDFERRRQYAVSLANDAESRLSKIQAKASSLIGVVTLAVPVFSWWLNSGRERLATASGFAWFAAHVLIVGAVASLALGSWALVRAQRLRSYYGRSLDDLISVYDGKFRPFEWAAELRTLALMAGTADRWADVIAEYFKAGQRFLGLALVLALASGFISYWCPEGRRPPLPVVVSFSEQKVSAATGDVWSSVATTVSVVTAIIGALLSFYFAIRYYRRGLGRNA